MNKFKLNKIRRLGVVSYLTVIGLFISIILNKKNNDYVNFHIRQSLGIQCISILGIICLLVNGILALIVYFLFVVLWVSGLVAALQMSTKPIPLLGEKFQELFSKIV